jgi:prenyltransferase beta subunit
MPNHKKGKNQGGLRDKEANKKDQFNYNLCSSHELIK